MPQAQQTNPLLSKSLMPGFSEPVRGSQAAFRKIMEAMAHPCRVVSLASMEAPAPLGAAAAQAALSLIDFETPYWLSPSLGQAAGLAEWLGFHTGAARVTDPAKASFALVDLMHDSLSLAAFHPGEAAYPDRSATIIALAPSLAGGQALAFSGPGIRSVAALTIPGLPADFPAQWAANRAAFPLGIDLVFAAGPDLVALPRSARLIGEAR
jgi:alpha-D-ribose 1-methylphosphonate 5-triphosphate synthase subunit PhnH